MDFIKMKVSAYCSEYKDLNKQRKCDHFMLDHFFVGCRFLRLGGNECTHPFALKVAKEYQPFCTTACKEK